MYAPGDAARDALDRRVVAAVAAVAAARGPVALASVVAAFYARRLVDFAEAVRRRERGARSMDVDGETESDEEDMDVDGDGDIDVDIDVDVDGRPLVPADSCVEVMGASWAARVAGVARGLRGDDARSPGAFGAVASAAAARAMESATRGETHRRARGRFDRRALPHLLRWLDAVPLAFLRAALDLADDAAEEWRARLEYAAHEHLGAVRTSEFFDVIVDFPDSLPAVDDLRRCLRRTTLHAQLTNSLRGALRRRLLIAGAPTADIIDTYRLAIRALSALDPSGVVLNVVSAPLKEYLRERKDTIRCVVTMLMGKDGQGGEGALLGGDEDADGEGGRLRGAEGEGDAHDAWEGEERDFLDREGDRRGATGKGSGGGGWDQWEPEPVESEAASSRGRRRHVDDSLGQLVSIYGSKELFINEYRNMLAERLLNKVGYDIDRETHTLELLKLRFGESSLHKCEVMLKDMNDSKRINGNVKAPPAPGTPAARDEASTAVLRESPLDATIVSALFWPPFSNEAPDFKLPPAMREMTDAYGKRYHHLKAPRQMNWKPTLGTVQVEVMRGEIEVEISVSPVEAALLTHFQTKERWGMEELARELGVPKAVARRKAVVWINQGLLVEEKGDVGEGFYRLTSGQEAKAAFGAAAADDEGGGGGAVASAEDQAAAGMKVYEQYVIGMLTNFPSLPLDRIHNMLKMFVSEPPYDKTSDQLEAFLAQLVAEDKVVQEGNQYRRRTG